MEKHVKIMIAAPLVFIGGLSVFQAAGRQEQADSILADTRRPRQEAAQTSTSVFKSADAPGTGKTGSTVIEQAIFDAFPKTTPTSPAARKKVAQASDFLAAAINIEGHLCARPIEARQADNNHYGIGCIERRAGERRINYLVNVHTGSVTPI